MKGPTSQPISSNAHIKVLPDAEYLGPDGAKQFSQLNGNLPGDHDEYVVLPRTMSWFSVFSFQNTGFVKDDEKLDPDAILKGLREMQTKDNEQRTEQGLNSLTIERWSVPPHYDPQTRRLEWGLLIRDDKTGSQTINYTTRILGREGVTAATLIATPENFDKSLPEFRKSLEGFSYDPEHDYMSFKEGDKVAEYGLAALITGGVAAAAVKSGAAKGLIAGGLLATKGFIKLIFVGIAGVVLAIWGKIKRMFGRGDS